MTRHRYMLLFGFAIVLLLMALGYDRISEVKWVGHTNFAVEFIVLDASDGKPIPDATIELRSGEDTTKQAFKLVSDVQGKSRKEFQNVMCWGDVSGLKFTNTTAFELPWGLVQVDSAGYEQTRFEYPALQKYIEENAKYIGNDCYELIMTFKLHRS